MSMNGVFDIFEKALDSAAGDVVLDFGPVECIDAAGVRALESLASRADGKSLKITLRSINPDVYRVLKLVKLDSRFSFAN
jgi:anti-anti-sigma regulatory factor